MPETLPSSVQKTKVATWSSFEDQTPAYALVANVDLVVIRYDDKGPVE